MKIFQVYRVNDKTGEEKEQKYATEDRKETKRERKLHNF